ncbi:hypothetical protein HMPREF3224_00334, partial [Anaerococcus hydrogenalis]
MRFCEIFINEINFNLDRKGVLFYNSQIFVIKYKIKIRPAIKCQEKI